MKRIVTISREFGSGGRTIAKLLADRLGWKYYDKEIVKAIAEESGFDPAFVDEHSEHSSTRSGLNYLLPAAGVPGIMQGMSAADFLWCVQRGVIERVANEAEPCVIVGRCADYILRDREDALHVFIHAPIAFRADRIVRLYGESEKKPEERLRDKDKRRGNNYRHFTGREWGASHNYDLCINTEKIGIEPGVELIRRVLLDGSQA